MKNSRLLSAIGHILEAADVLRGVPQDQLERIIQASLTLEEGLLVREFAAFLRTGTHAMPQTRDESEAAEFSGRPEPSRSLSAREQLIDEIHAILSDRTFIANKEALVQALADTPGFPRSNLQLERSSLDRAIGVLMKSLRLTPLSRLRTVHKHLREKYLRARKSTLAGWSSVISKSGE